VPTDAERSDRFAYKLEVTSEEEPVDGAIKRRYTMEFADCQERARITSEHAVQSTYPRVRNCRATSPDSDSDSGFGSDFNSDSVSVSG
jgi:hypothetical protein